MSDSFGEMGNYKKEIIDRLDKISGKYSMYEVFSDWIKCCSIAISNTYTVPNTQLWKIREKEYVDTMKKYKKEDGLLFSEMLLLLELEIKSDERDVLGEIYMESEMGSKFTGQFFSPYKISELLSKVSKQEKKDNKKKNLYEPTCGSGGNIIAAATDLKKQGIDYRKVLEVVAQDLDIKSVYMCYLQLSIMGISAECIQGDALERCYEKTNRRENVFYTPEKIKRTWEMEMKNCEIS